MGTIGHYAPNVMTNSTPIIARVGAHLFFQKEPRQSGAECEGVGIVNLCLLKTFPAGETS